MTTTPAPPRLMYRLISRQALRDQMKYRRMTVRELAVACGRESYKSTIGNLSSGARNSVSAHLARRIEEALFPGCAPGMVFTPTMTTSHVDTPVPAPRGRRAA